MKLEQKYPAKRAFVTGAASGFGLAICMHLASRGWKLLIADINAKRLEQAEAQLRQHGAETFSMVLDVTRQEALQDAANTVKQLWGGVDLVFNNAGIASAGMIDDLPLEEWEKVINVDLWSVIYGCRAFVPLLKNQGGGCIINTASSAGTLSGPEMSPYNVAKAGVVSLSETLKSELSGFDIGVTVVCPTVFATSLGDSLTSERAMEKRLLAQLKKSRFTSQHIVDDVFRALEKGRLYVMTQPDAKWAWRLKRWMPESYFRLIAYLYRNRKWLYAEQEEADRLIKKR
ncbi:SDR family NAD(P)-dependent oxidoreductase [Pseudomonas brassicacearum]|uniref:Short-chain dehydrogenase n=1 Tax=Pseudomonas brassicacearum TaxID=930166 RepID=A0A423JWR6_9PSED|nr:SDR family NAD(P)-dependent oxidoreductase [Pseudomonas brassicacearum]RON42114.1 hypothetical protein BK664_00550 [Pseudomonas brassicacearum]